MTEGRIVATVTICRLDPILLPDAMDKFELDTFLPYRLNRVSEWIGDRFSQAYREPYQMSRWEWRTLANLGQHGRLTAKQITGYGNMDKTKVSRAVSALEQRGWLLRETDRLDARQDWLVLTASGRTVFETLAEQGMKFDMRLAQHLGNHQVEALRQGLEAVEKLMDEDAQT